uniref:Protein S-acyltransferase n=1 Tax=Daucus carota subsp. sativus TaxID=79200 RepID=A0A162AJR5_DAUCS
MTIIRALFCRCRDGDGDGDHRCRNSLPCLLDPAQRSTMYLKVALVMLHLIFIGVLFLFYGNQTTIHPWYVGMYLLLFVATIAQYFFTAGSSPGYVLDTMRTINETNALARTSLVSKQPATSKNGNIVITVDHREAGRNLLGSNELSWTKLVMDLYPPGAPCRWVDVIMIVLLAILLILLIFLLLLLFFHSYLIMTNQTTFELVRRRRIAYLRGIPGRVYPFSKGICKNLYNFCFSRSTLYGMERLPTAQELEEKSRPYTCLNILSCRCC